MKKFLLIMVSLIFVCISVFGQSKIKLTIDGETYERDYPTNVADYKKLTDDLVTMYNTLSTDYTKLHKDYTDEVNDRIDFEKGLKSDIDNTVTDIDSVIQELEVAKSTLDKYIKKENGFHFGFGGNVGYLMDSTITLNLDLLVKKKSYVFTLGPKASIRFLETDKNPFSYGLSLGIHRIF